MSSENIKTIGDYKIWVDGEMEKQIISYLTNAITQSLDAKNDFWLKNEADINKEKQYKRHRTLYWEIIPSSLFGQCMMAAFCLCNFFKKNLSGINCRLVVMNKKVETAISESKPSVFGDEHVICYLEYMNNFYAIDLSVRQDIRFSNLMAYCAVANSQESVLMKAAKFYNFTTIKVLGEQKSFYDWILGDPSVEYTHIQSGGTTSSVSKIGPLKRLTLTQLQVEARSAGIRGRSKMSKADLIKAIRRHKGR
jgi:hypothetical protein